MCSALILPRGKLRSFNGFREASVGQFCPDSPADGGHDSPHAPKPHGRHEFLQTHCRVKGCGDVKDDRVVLSFQTLTDDPGEAPNGGSFRGAIKVQMDGSVVLHFRGKKER